MFVQRGEVGHLLKPQLGGEANKRRQKIFSTQHNF